jgi:hypothetical protein
VRSLRWPAAVVCWLLLVSLSLLALAGVRPGMPLFPAATLAFEPPQLAAADAQQGDGVLRIRGADANGLTLVMQPVDRIQAARFRYMVLQLAEVPRALRATAIWRVDGVFHTSPLPGSFRSAVTWDMQASSSWQGRLDSVGVGLLPTDYLAPIATLEREFAFISGRLESESWAGALRALSTQWRVYRPWDGRSNNTAGVELSAMPGPPLQLFVFVMVLVTLLAAAIGGGMPSLRQALSPAMMVALSTLAMWQAAQVGMRAQVAIEARAAVAHLPDWPLAAVPAIGNDAARLLALLEERAPPRLIVWGESRFMREYPTWLLRDLNTASLDDPSQLNGGGPRVADNVLVLAGPGGWRVDADRLELAGMRFAVEPLMVGAVLQAYRVTGWAGDD